MGNLVNKDKVINLVHEVILEFMSVEDPMTTTDKMLLKINKKICNGVKDLDRDE